MTNFDAVVAAVRSYGVAPSGAGLPRWYVYRRAAVKGGEVPPDALIFFSKEKAQAKCDRLNAEAVIEMWRYG